SSGTYTVKKGDTLSSIATTHEDPHPFQDQSAVNSVTNLRGQNT
ncbi:LysM domain-containing protein, partial [Streptomyces sp. NPDC005969]